MNDIQTLAEIGRLHMENLDLRARLEACAEIIQRLSSREPAVEPADAPEGDQPGATE
jgi:hypothetical protein